METGEKNIYYPVPKEIKKQWGKIVKWFDSTHDFKIWRLKTKQGKKHSQLYIKLKDTRKETGDIILTYLDSNDERIISSGQGADELVRFIEKVGVKRVYGLKIKTSGGLLVNTSTAGIEDKNPKQIGSYFVVTKTPNKEKFAQIQTIIDQTGFKAKVKYLEETSETSK